MSEQEESDMSYEGEEEEFEGEEEGGRKYELCKWVDRRKFYLKLLETIRPFGITLNDVEVFCGFDDDQEFYFSLVRCVPLELIKKRRLHAPGRLVRIREWATPQILNSIPIQYFELEGEDKKIAVFADLPSFSRVQKIEDMGKDEGIYEISDGIHRTQRARELGLQCILADVEELVKYTKKYQDSLEEDEEK